MITSRLVHQQQASIDSKYKEAQLTFIFQMPMPRFQSLSFKILVESSKWEDHHEQRYQDAKNWFEEREAYSERKEQEAVLSKKSFCNNVVLSAYRLISSLVVWHISGPGMEMRGLYPDVFGMLKEGKALLPWCRFHGSAVDPSYEKTQITVLHWWCPMFTTALSHQ